MWPGLAPLESILVLVGGFFAPEDIRPVRRSTPNFVVGRESRRLSLGLAVLAGGQPTAFEAGGVEAVHES